MLDTPNGDRVGEPLECTNFETELVCSETEENVFIRNYKGAKCRDSVLETIPSQSKSTQKLHPFVTMVPPSSPSSRSINSFTSKASTSRAPSGGSYSKGAALVRRQPSLSELYLESLIYDNRERLAHVELREDQAREDPKDHLKEADDCIYVNVPFKSTEVPARRPLQARRSLPPKLRLAEACYSSSGSLSSTSSSSSSSQYASCRPLANKKVALERVVDAITSAKAALKAMGETKTEIGVNSLSE